MSTRDICALRLPPIAPDALLFMWRVSAMLEDAIDVCRAWGFEPKSEIVWCKRTRRGADHFGMGRYVRASHESCLIASRGRGASLIRDRSTRSVFSAEVPREHSRKPETFYGVVEKLCDGPRVELFARATRPGWDAIGEALGSRLDLPLAPEAP